MPVIKSAIKKLRKDKKREKLNDAFRDKLKEALKKAKKGKKQASITEALSLVDKAVKKHIIHQNKAARIKSGFSKMLPKDTKKTEKTSIKTEKPAKKTPAKKTASKKA